MDLELNEKEIEALEVLIETRIAAIGPEIHHTDTPSYREALRQSREVLTGILKRLSKPEAIRL
jgi:hypothetical protein